MLDREAAGMKLYWKLKKSRAVLVVGGLATLVLLAALTLYRWQGMPPWQLALTLVLAAGVGLGVTWFAAGMVASACQQAMLEQLHIKLQPDAFVAAYAPVAEAMDPDTAGAVTAAVNLADGYCAAGDWQRALDTLVMPSDRLAEPRRSALQTLVWRSRCRYRLWGADVPGAQAAVQAFACQVASLKESNPPLAKNLQADLVLYETWLGLLTGHTADCGALERALRQLPTKLAKLDVCWMLMLAGQASHDGEREQRYRTLFRQEGGDLAAARQLRGQEAAAI